MNLGRYFERIGFGGSAAPTLETLNALHERHVHSVPFEKFQRLAYPACRADDRASRLGQHVLELEGHERLILDNEDLEAGESWDMCRVVHCLFVPPFENRGLSASNPRFSIKHAPILAASGVF